MLAWLPAGNARAAENASVQRTLFDHLTTGFELTGQHRDLPCESCHVNAIFKGTSRDCEQCHGVGTSVRASAKPANHILTSNNCGACHTPVAWNPAVNFSHNEVMGSCVSCHYSGSPVGGEGPNHIVTDLDCSVCHSTIGWAGAVFNHNGITTDCASCHNNVSAKGQPATHIPTIPVGAGRCEGCHSSTNYTTWHDVTGVPAIHATAAGWTCQSCHETAQFMGMVPSTASAAHDSRPSAALDKNHPASGDCGICHDTSSFSASAGLRPANHIPTSAPCAQCHLTPGQNSSYSVTGTHQGVTNCLSCHGPPPAGGWANITIVGTSSTHHMPIGNLDCNGSGCHSISNVNPGGFHLGAASINTPTLNVAGHTSVLGQVPACTTCHESATYVGMVASTSSAAGDSRPNVTLDKNHPSTGECNSCHSTTPTFNTDQTGTAKPANHIPTSAPCAQCHTTAGNNALYSVTGTHQGVTNCLSCHGPPPAGGWANVTIVGMASTNHMPIGNLDCNGSGCHTAAKVTPGGFKLGAASINSPTLNVAGHTTVLGQVPACTTCHESAPYVGMIASTASTASDSRPTAYDNLHPTSGDCVSCHTTAPTFASDMTGGSKPSNHIPTSAACAQCHTTANNYALYSVTGTHQGVTNCLSCHGPPPAGGWANITIVDKASTNHIPIGNLDCNGSGCHTTAKVTPGGFKLGVANINAPTLSSPGHITVSGQVGTCQTCHQAAPYTGMIPSTSSTAGDSRPNGTLDPAHPTTGDCGDCHTQTPTFSSDVSKGAKPSNHIPTNATCSQCHTTAGNFALYSVTGTHQGVNNCLSCHGPPPAGGWANITIVGTSSTNHMPIGNLDCNGSGCHSTAKVTPGGFKLGAASINSPTLNVAGHATVAGKVPACTTCHETAPYVGMLASTSNAAGDSRPNATLDKSHPTAGDCNGCHTTTPTFTTDQTGSVKPANHIPTNAPCAQCHTTAGNNAVYSVTGTHQGVNNCLSCHAPAVANTFANITIVSTTGINHFPIGSLDCNGSGCHSTAKVTPGGFKLGAANINAPTLNTAGHTTVAGPVPACTTCHETAPYVGMIASSSNTAGDSRPNATLDKSHPTTGDCGGCHTKTPTFSSNVTGGSKPANHIPTNAPCAQCHTTGGNYAAYVMGATGHSGITKGCATCHAYGLSFANMAPPTLKQPPSGATGHIPSNPPNGSKLNVACELCHTPTNFTTFAGTVMRHAYVTTMTCMSCHETGMQWKTNGNLWTRPNGHHTGQDCGSGGCHSSRDKRAVRPNAAATDAGGGLARSGSGSGGTMGLVPAVGGFNHIRVAATPCASCHSTASGTGKPADHIPSGNGCGSCHTTRAWLPVAIVDHTQVQGSCVSCHNGTMAQGKSKSHIASGNTCETCHTTNAWTPARFDHAGVAAHTCRTCHDSVHAMGLPSSHVPTAAQCDTCHGTLAWKPAKVNHTTLTSRCVSCHNNAIALGVPATHMSTKLECATCHSYPDWSLTHFTHTTSAYPGDHKAALACSACHTSNTELVAWPAPANAGSCAGCHSRDFKAAAHPKTAAGILYTSSELRDCTGACHVYRDATLKTIIKSQPGPYHRPSNSAFKH